MCGITGVLQRDGSQTSRETLESMLALIHHRGPDERGIFQDEQASLCSARLSIIDLATGQQPLCNEDGTIWITFNGEVYNYVELMAELKTKGHQFRTRSDTEVIVHLYEELGEACLDRMNGQFAFAIWDSRREQLFMARDRVGIRPLFYTWTPEALVFGSEVKCLLAHEAVSPQVDPIALDQVFTFWSTLTPRTIFRDIYELQPGHYMVATRDRFEIKPYWTLRFPAKEDIAPRDIEDTLDEFEALFTDSIRLRLRADVPVAAYLSGGLDSCTTTDFILRLTQSDLQTFSIQFTDEAYDETGYQNEAAAYLGTRHKTITCDQSDIGRHFADVIWHTETPILRTSPVPMYLLSKLVRENNIKVVVTGEGADELLAGYNIFKEALVRRFWAQDADSDVRPLLLGALYPYLPQPSHARAGIMRTFFGTGLTDTDDPLYSHRLRWRNTARIKQFLSPAMREQASSYDALGDLTGRLDGNFTRSSPLGKAQYLESTIFMSSYLLSSQGDRVGMANSVEGRYPFLDHRIIEFCAGLPASHKLLGLKEKRLIKRLMDGRLPEPIVKRSKQPYRAPITASLIGEDAPPFVHDLLSDAALDRAGLFNPTAVTRLLAKARTGARLSETDAMALAGIVSAQLVQHLFVDNFRTPALQGAYRTCGTLVAE